MIAYYPQIKAVHVHAIGLSFAIFFLRGLLMLARSKFTNHAALRYTSYTVDTVLLTCGVILAAMIGPEQPWILTKIVLLIAYIGVGTYAIKRGRTPRTRLIAALCAVAIFAYIVGVALSKSPASWFA